MAFAIRATLDAIESHLKAHGKLEHVRRGEPKGPPQANASAALWMSSVRVVALPASGITELHTVMLRFYYDFLQDEQNTGLADREQLEDMSGRVVQEVAELLTEDYDLGATVNHVDIGGIYGTELTAEWGHVEISGTMYRVVDMTIPLVVDDSSTPAA